MSVPYRFMTQKMAAVIAAAIFLLAYAKPPSFARRGRGGGFAVRSYGFAITAMAQGIRPSTTEKAAPS